MPRHADLKKFFARIRRTDQALHRIIRSAGEFRLKPQKTESTFEALMEAIVYQQLHAKAAATIYGRVRALFAEDRFPTAQEVLAMTDAAYRSAGLSRSKTAAIRDLAKHVHEGLIPDFKSLRKMTNNEIIASLTRVKGIGPWTVEMLLIFRLGRLNVMPTTDYGVRAGFAHTYRKRKLPTPQQLVKHSKAWEPFQTVAAWYFWKAVDLQRKKS